MSTTLYGLEHVRRYRETDGEEGHIWKEESTILLLTTTGRNTGKETTTPLIYQLDGDNPVIVASKDSTLMTMWECGFTHLYSTTLPL